MSSSRATEPESPHSWTPDEVAALISGFVTEVRLLKQRVAALESARSASTAEQRQDLLAVTTGRAVAPSTGSPWSPSS